MTEGRDGPGGAKPGPSGLPPPPAGSARRPIFQPGAPAAAPDPEGGRRSIPPPPAWRPEGARPPVPAPPASSWSPKSQRPSVPPPASAPQSSPASAPQSSEDKRASVLRSRPEAPGASILRSRPEAPGASTPPSAVSPWSAEGAQKTGGAPRREWTAVSPRVANLPGQPVARDTTLSGRESVPGARPSGVPARVASARGALPQAFVRVDEPSRGAARREGVLLAAYVVLFVIGVWTVVVAELSPQEPDNLHPQTVTAPPQKPQSAGN